MKTAVIVISDTHVNSTKALAPPRIQLDDEQTVTPSPFQKRLWKAYQKFVTEARADTEGYERVVVLNGDLGELDTKRRSYQIITPNKATILEMTIDALTDIAELGDRLYVVRGTPAHIGKSGWLEEAVAKNFEHAVPYSLKVMSHWHLKGKVNGVGLDIAHHGQTSGYPQNRNAAADRLAHRTWQDYIVRGERPPQIVVRSHMHHKLMGDWQQTNVFFTPCWQGHTDFTYRIGAENDNSDIGGLVFKIEDNGQWSYKYYMYDVKREIETNQL